MSDRITSFPGTAEDWHGYRLHKFQLDGIDCVVATPDSPLEGSHWVWRARFLTVAPVFALAMLRRGFYIAHIDISDLAGGEKTMKRMDAFHRFLTGKFAFAPKAMMAGYSLGALAAFNWSIRNPEKITGIYTDSPICNLEFWPRTNSERRTALENGLVDENGIVREWNPVDHLEPLAKAGIPVLAVYDPEDEAVPPKQNAMLLEERYKALGGNITHIRKSGENPRRISPDNPDAIADFALQAAGIETEK